MGKWEQKMCRRPLRHGASGWVWRIPLLLLLWSWFDADYRCQEKFVAFARATVTRTPAERSSIQQLLQEHEKSFFSPLVEKRKVKKTSRCWEKLLYYYYYKESFFGGNAGNVAQNLSFWTVFNVLAPIKSCRRGFGKRWASPWGEDQHEGLRLAGSGLEGGSGIILFPIHLPLTKHHFFIIITITLQLFLDFEVSSFFPTDHTLPLQTILID